MSGDFERTRAGSKDLFEKVSLRLPGGLNGELRAADPFSLFIDRADGARKWDVDGNEYIGYSMGSAALQRALHVRGIGSHVLHRGRHLGGAHRGRQRQNDKSV